MAKQGSLEEMFLDDIRDLYDAEKQLVRALPKLAKAANDSELENALREHLEVTKNQVQRLEQVFEMLDARAKGIPCQGMKGIVQEGSELLEEDQPETLLDAGLAAAGRKVEHYEMVGYESARAIAMQLGRKDAAELLQQTLQEEMQADRTLAQIAKRLVKEASRGAAPAEEAQGKSTQSRGGQRSQGSRSSQSRGRSSQGSGRASKGSSNATTDHEQIRRWAEERGAQPACVKGTGSKGDTGMIRLDFPGYSGEESLQPISWDDWFEKFDENGLALLYQETTARGQKSNFNKLVKRETAAQSGAKPRTRAAR